MFCTSLEVKV